MAQAVALTPEEGPALAKKIFIIDDSPTVRMAARLALERAGFEVIEEDNPVVVSLRVGREKPDLVLLDVQMPLLQGDRVAKLLQPSKRATKIILYSTLPEAELSRMVTETGVHGYIHKTNDPSGLAAQVRRILEE